MKALNIYIKISCKQFMFFSLLLLFSLFGYSQNNLPIDTYFSQALKNGTRTNKGIPGKSYWQNSASYQITAVVKPDEKQLIGSETISYKNNSLDTLNQIVFHVFQNLYKKGSVRDTPVNPDDINSGLIIENLKINNKPITDITTSGTQLIIDLATPILPSELATIEVSWQFSIPTKSDIRMGGKDASTFFLGQWYPKIAVYDDIKGWDRNIYTGGQRILL
jgi:hypothetical protein